MFNYNTKMKAAIFAVRAISVMNNDKPVSSKALATIMGIAPRYLEQIFQGLCKAGILVGERGPAGGYRLKRQAALVTVGDIIQSIIEIDARKGPKSLPYVQHGKGNAKINAIFEEAETLIFDQLYNLTIADLNK